MRPVRVPRDSDRDSESPDSGALLPRNRTRLVHLLDGTPVDSERESAVLAALQERIKDDFGDELEDKDRTSFSWLRLLWGASFAKITAAEATALGANRRIRTLAVSAEPWNGADQLLADLRSAIESSKRVSAVTDDWRGKLQALYRELRTECPDLEWYRTVRRAATLARDAELDGDPLDSKATKRSAMIGTVERRVYACARRALKKERDRLFKEPRGINTLAARYAYVYLSLHGPTMYQGTADELIALITTPDRFKSVCDRADGIRSRSTTASKRLRKMSR